MYQTLESSSFMFLGRPFLFSSLTAMSQPSLSCRKVGIDHQVIYIQSPQQSVQHSIKTKLHLINTNSLLDQILTRTCQHHLFNQIQDHAFSKVQFIPFTLMQVENMVACQSVGILLSETKLQQGNPPCVHQHSSSEIIGDVPADLA